jgi:hypothetical protein
MGSVGRSDSNSGRTCTRSPRILGHCGAKRLMSSILVKLLLGHHLNHVQDVWSKATGSQRVGGDVPYLIRNILKDVEAHRLHESIQEVPVISRNSL